MDYLILGTVTFVVIMLVRIGTDVFKTREDVLNLSLCADPLIKLEDALRESKYSKSEIEAAIYQSLKAAGTNTSRDDVRNVMNEFGKLAASGGQQNIVPLAIELWSWNSHD